MFQHKNLVTILHKEDESDYVLIPKPNFKNGETFLHTTASVSNNDCHFKRTKELLINGAIIDAQNHLGDTPLHYFVKKNNPKSIELLLNYGADVNIKNKKGDIALVNALVSKNTEIVRILIENGSDVNSVNRDRLTPLHFACYPKHLDNIKLLLKSNAKIDVFDSVGDTPTMRFFQSYPQTKQVLEFLLKYSDVNSIERNGKNILSCNLYPHAWEMIVQHVAKLQALDFTVDPRILESISSHDKYSEYYSQCTRELSEAKVLKLKNSWLTFFNFLVYSRKKLKNYAGNEDFSSYLETKDCVKKFLIYGQLMQNNMRKGLKRRVLFDESAVLLSGCLPVFNPDHLVVRDILDCIINSKDLCKLCGIFMGIRK